MSSLREHTYSTLVLAGLGAVLSAFFLAPAAIGGIDYDARRQVVCVVGFPADYPCTVDRLVEADQRHGWGLVRRKDVLDTFSLAAGLWIGSDDGVDTHFQLGTPERPTETLIVDGDVVVHSHTIAAEVRTAGKPAVNRLTLGTPSNPTIRPVLKIASSAARPHSLYIGALPGPDSAVNTSVAGGQLHVHGGTITAAVQDMAHAIGSPGKRRRVYLAGDSIILRNMTFSWVAGTMAYGLGTVRRGRSVTVENSVFEHGAVAFETGRFRLRGCTIRHFETAIVDGGTLDATLIDCVLENNDHHWNIPHTARGLVLVDCRWDRARKRNYLWRGAFAKRKRHYPSVTSRRHVVLKAVDTNGNPVPKAGLTVECENGATSVRVGTRNSWITDETGRTPAKGSEHPVLLTEFVATATDDGKSPRTDFFSYAVTAKAPGFNTTTLTGIRPTTSWDMVQVTLEAAGRKVGAP